MKTIFYIFLTVYIIGSITATISTYYQYNYPKWKKDEQQMTQIFACLAVCIFIGFFIFGVWSAAMWSHNLW